MQVNSSRSIVEQRLYDNRLELRFDQEITGMKHRTEAYFP